MDQMRLKASSGRFKVVLVTWLPFIAVYYFMGDFVSGCKFPSICVSGVVAYSPIPIPFIVAANGTHGPDLVVLPLVPLVLHADDQAPGHVPDDVTARGLRET